MAQIARLQHSHITLTPFLPIAHHLWGHLKTSKQTKFTKFTNFGTNSQISGPGAGPGPGPPGPGPGPGTWTWTWPGPGPRH